MNDPHPSHRWSADALSEADGSDWNGLQQQRSDCALSDRDWREALRASEERYRILLESIDEGFCVIEMVFDHNDNPVDYRFLEVSPSFEKQTGIANAVGRTMRQIAPRHEQHWFEIYGRVASTGEPVRFENRAEELGRWYDVYAFRVDDPQLRRVAILFNDATQRKHADEALRATEARQSFLLRFCDALRPLSDPAAIKRAAAEALGQQLDLSAVGYAELEADGDTAFAGGEYSDGRMVSVHGRHCILHHGDRFADVLRAGEELYVEDFWTDERGAAGVSAATRAIGMRSAACVPLNRNGSLIRYLYAIDAEPRKWSEEDRLILREVAGRSWEALERARAEEALSASEALLQKTISAETIGVLFFRLEGRIIDANAAFARMSGYSREELLTTVDWETLTAPEFMRVTARAAANLIELGETTPYEKQLIRRDGTRWWGLFAPTRLSGSGGESVCGEFIIDITEQKRVEDALRRAHEQLEGTVLERTRELAAANASLRAEMAQRRRAEAGRRDLLRHLVNAQEAERQRISRELHDQLGQQVSALTLKLSMLKHEAPTGGKLHGELEKLEQLAKATDSDLDFIVWELRPTALDDLGLADALGEYADSWSRHFGVEARFDVSGIDGERLDPEVETVIYRVAQEALSNIAKHARANRVEIRLERGASCVELRVRDDGVGFQVAQPLSTGAKGLGLVGMRERAALLGGKLVIRSEPGKGATVAVRVPSAPARFE